VLQREWLRGAVILAAFAAAAAAQILVRRDPYETEAWALYACAGLLLVTATPVRLFSRPISAADPAVPSVTQRVLAFVAVVAIAAAAFIPPAHFPPALALLTWGCGLALILIAMREAHASRPGAVIGWPAVELLALGAVVTLAALARFAWIDALPGRYFDDEARVGLVALQMSRKGIADFFTLGWNAWPVLGLAVHGALGIATDPSTTAVRLTSAAFGTLAVITTYLAARQLFSPRVALLAAFILAINRTAIDISRMGTCHAQVMALAPLTFALWWRGINTGRAASYAGAGIVMGLCLYTYNAGQLVIVAWLAFVLLAALSARNRAAHRRGAVLAFAVFCMTVAPLLWRITDGLQFRATWQQWLALGRGRQVVTEVVDLVQDGRADAAVAFLRGQGAVSWLGYFALPSRAYELGYRNGGMSDDVTAALFLLGLALCLFGRLRARGDFMVCWWAVMTLFGSVLTRDAPVFQRLVGALPAVAILAALPLEALFAWARNSRGKRAIAGAVVATAAAVAVVQNWRTYFVEFAGQTLDYPSMLGRLLQELPPERPVVLSGAEYAWHAAGWLQNQLSFNHELVSLNFRDRDLRQTADTANLLPLRADSRMPGVIIFGPTQVTQTSYLRQLYPGAEIQMRGQNMHVLAVARIPMANILAKNGLRLQRTTPSGAADLGVVDPFAPQAAGSCDPAACTLEWSGSIYWPHGGDVEIHLRGDRIERVGLGGAELPLHDGTATARVRLARGWQPFVLRQAGGAPWTLIARADGIELAANRGDFMAETEPRGLLGIYERHGQRLGEVVDAQLNHVADERFFQGRGDVRFRLPYDVHWRGWLRIETAGEYEFELQAAGKASIELGGSLLTSVEDVPNERVSTGVAARRLAAGLHPIAARWNARAPFPGTPIAAFQLYWSPPGAARQLVPPTAFVPATTVSVITAITPAPGVR
jgi:hypothetical protein